MCPNYLGIFFFFWKTMPPILSNNMSSDSRMESNCLSNEPKRPELAAFWFIFREWKIARDYVPVKRCSQFETCHFTRTVNHPKSVDLFVKIVIFNPQVQYYYFDIYYYFWITSFNTHWCWGQKIDIEPQNDSWQHFSAVHIAQCTQIWCQR